MTKSDPVGVEYYLPLGTAESYSDIAFYTTATLSIVALQVDRLSHPDIYNAIQALFALSVLLLFVFGLAIRLHWSTRAQSKRITDFISNSFEISLASQMSTGYYNNSEPQPFRHAAAALLENSLFTKHITQKMLSFERTKFTTYAVLWVLAMLNRATDLALIATVAQVIFSEQVISRWARMEWLRARVEQIYEDVYSIIQSKQKANSREYQARVLDYLLRYETSKAQAGISMSTKIFNKLNPSLSARWKEIASILSIDV